MQPNQIITSQSMHLCIFPSLVFCLSQEHKEIGACIGHLAAQACVLFNMIMVDLTQASKPR